MNRKAVIVVLMLGAAATVLAWAGSYGYLPWGFLGFEGYRDADGRDTYGKHWGTMPDKGGVFQFVGVSRGELRWVTQRGVPPSGAFKTDILPLPPSFLFVLFAAYPTTAFIRGPLRRRYSRAYRRERGLCVECCYNLTGNGSGVCPECGTKIEAVGGEGE